MGSEVSQISDSNQCFYVFDDSYTWVTGWSLTNVMKMKWKMTQNLSCMMLMSKNCTLKEKSSNGKWWWWLMKSCLFVCVSENVKCLTKASFKTKILHELPLQLIQSVCTQWHSSIIIIIYLVILVLSFMCHLFVLVPISCFANIFVHFYKYVTVMMVLR